MIQLRQLQLMLVGAIVGVAAVATVTDEDPSGSQIIRALEEDDAIDQEIDCMIVKLDTQFEGGDEGVSVGKEDEFQCLTSNTHGEDDAIIPIIGIEGLIDSSEVIVNELASGRAKVTNVNTNGKVAKVTPRSEVKDAPSFPQRRLAIGSKGAKSVLVLRVTAPDKSLAENASVLANSVFGKLVGGNDVSTLASQYAACSQGQLKFEPQTGNLITDGVAEVYINSPSQGTDRLDLMNRAMESARSMGLPLSSTDHVMICLPPGSAGNWVAFGYFNNQRTVYNGKWCTSVSAQMHEIGHNMYMDHSNHGSVSYGDQTGLMGYSYDSNNGPDMCFNGAKMSQLGWYQDAEVTVSPSLGDKYFSGKLVGFNDYPASKTSAQDYSVLVKIVSSTAKNYYLSYNRAEGFNRGTMEMRNKVTIVQGADRSASDLIAGLGVGESFVIPNFDNKGSDLKIEVMDYGSESTINYMEVQVSMSGCQTDADCDDGDACNGKEFCSAGYECQPGLPLPGCFCGNNVCDAGETCSSCPGDCASSCRELDTGFDANNGSFGNMFDVRAKKSIEIERFDIHTWSTSTVTARVWTKKGRYRGSDRDSSSWEILQEASVVGMGEGKPTPLPDLPRPVIVEASDYQAFYITLTSNDLRYTNGERNGKLHRADDSLQVFEGLGKVFEFGATYNARVFNGVIHYAKSRQQDPDVTQGEDTSLTLFIKTDDEAPKLSWKVRKYPNLNVVKSHSGYAAGAVVNVSHEFTREACYDFSIYNSEGDGTGELRLTQDGEKVLLSNGSFGDQATTLFGKWEVNTLLGSNELWTAFDGNNGQAGSMFDIKAKTALQVTSLDIHVVQTRKVLVKVFTKSGSMIGHDRDVSSWKLVQQVHIKGNGTARPSKVPPFSRPVQVAEGMIQAFYVTLEVNGMRYTNGKAFNKKYVGNDHLDILEGYGKRYPFGRSYKPRVFNGVVHYDVMKCGAEAGASNYNLRRTLAA